MEYLLQYRSTKNNYGLRLHGNLHSRKEFPFECPRGRVFLERHPHLGSFRDFVVRHPEYILACRSLNIADVRFPITSNFKRRLSSFRGSLKLDYDGATGSAIVNALSNSTAHLDVFGVSLYRETNDEYDESTLRRLATVSSNKIVWDTHSEVALAFVGASRIVLDLDYEASEIYTEEELQCNAASAFGLTRRDCVEELHWGLSSYKLYNSLPPCFEEGLRALGQLSALRSTWETSSIKFLSLFPRRLHLACPYSLQILKVTK